MLLSKYKTIFQNLYYFLNDLGCVCTIKSNILQIENRDGVESKNGMGLICIFIMRRFEISLPN